MKTEIKVVNENEKLTQSQLKLILVAETKKMNVDVINKELSKESIMKIQNIRLVSSNLTDFITRLNKTMAKTNVYKGVEVIYHDFSNISLLFKKKNFFNIFVYEDVTGSFTLNNIFKDFDTFEAQLGWKPQFSIRNSNMNYLRSGFLYSLPLYGMESKWTLSGFNRNNMFVSSEMLTTRSSIKGLQLGYENRVLAFYAKENYNKSVDETPFKWVIRYKDKNMLNFVNADLKCSTDLNRKIDYLGRISKEITWPFAYLENGFFVKNRTEAVISSKSLDLGNDRSACYFGTEPQSSKMFLNSTIRLGTINSLGKRYYSVFSYVNGLVYRKDNSFVHNLNAGIGARFFIYNNFVFEGLINLDRRKDQKKAICRLIYGD